MHSHHCDESVVTENPGSYEVVEEEDQPGLGDRSSRNQKTFKSLKTLLKT